MTGVSETQVSVKMGRQIPANSGERFAQFLPIPPVPSIPETAEPLITMRLRHCCPCPDNLPAFATSVARGADVNLKSTTGVTPLELALTAKYKHIEKLLRDHGAR